MTTQHGLTDTELAALSEAEREALLAEPSEDEAKLAAGAPGVVDEETDPLKKGADAAPVDEIKDDEPPAERETVAVPFEAPEVDPEKVKAALADLKKRFDDGEITLDEYLDNRDAVKDQVRDAELAAEHKYQVERTVWENTVEDFLDANKAYRTDPVLHDAIDATVKRMAQDPALQSLTDRQLILKAHEEVAKRFSVPGDKPTPKDPAAALREQRKPDLTGVPRTLADIPATAPANADADEFSNLDALTAKAAGGDAQAQMALEQALGRMTPAQQERYARAA